MAGLCGERGLFDYSARLNGLDSRRIGPFCAISGLFLTFLNFLLTHVSYTAYYACSVFGGQ